MRRVLPAGMLVGWVLLSGCLGGGGGGGEQAVGGSDGGSNHPPQVSGRPKPEAVVGEFYSFKPAASDLDGDALTFSVAHKPEWANFDPTTGRLFGNPEAGDIGMYEDIRITASDGISNVSLPTFDIYVNQMGEGSVTLTWLPPTQNADGSPLTDLAGYRIYVGQNPGHFSRVITLNNPGLSAYVVENLAPDKWFFTMTSVNSRGQESRRSAIVRKKLG
jgi:Putative Ig domain